MFGNKQKMGNVNSSLVPTTLVPETAIPEE